MRNGDSTEQDNDQKRRDLSYRLCWGNGTRNILHNWCKYSDDRVLSLSTNNPSGSYLIITEYFAMPAVLDALGLLPDGVHEVCQLDSHLLTGNTKAQEMLDELIDAGATVLLDERDGTGAPLHTVSGSAVRVNGLYGHLLL